MLDDENCYSDAPYKVRMVDDSVALKGFAHKNMSESVITQYIQSKQLFTHGKIEIRASFSLESGLSPFIILTNSGDNRYNFYKNMSLTFINDEYFGHFMKSEIVFETLSSSPLSTQTPVLRSARYGQFRIFTIEWNNSHIIMKIDGNPTQELMKTDLISKSDSFQLNLGIETGGTYNQGKNLSEEILDQVDCPAFIVDYVRYYQFVNEVDVRQYGSGFENVKEIHLINDWLMFVPWSKFRMKN